MGEPFPGYPAAMSTLAQTTTGPARWHPTRVVAALLAFTAVVLVMVGSFLPLYSGTLEFGPNDIEVTIGAWSSEITGTAEPGDVPTIGYPLMFAAIVLACAAAMCWYAATPAAGPGVGRVSALTTAIGGAFLVGTVWTTALMVVNGVDSVILLGTVSPGLETGATYLTGYWLLLVAALLSLAAAVLAMVPVRVPTWALAAPDASTPPYGLVLPVRPHPAPPPTIPGALRIDPLTGHPLPPDLPGGVPTAYPPQPHHAPGPVPSAVGTGSPAPPAPPAPRPPTARPDPPQTPRPAPESSPGPAADEPGP